MARPSRPADPAAAMAVGSQPVGSPPPSLPVGPDAIISGLALLVVLASCAPFGRVFSSWHWAGPVVSAAVAASVAVFLARRAGWRPGWWVVAGVLATWVVGTASVLPGATDLGLPLAGAVQQAGLASTQALHLVPGLVVPAPVASGFALWSAWAAGLAGTATAYLSGRQRSLGALVPGLVLFAVASALAAGPGRAWAVGLFVAAAALYWLAHNRLMSRGSLAWPGASNALLGMVAVLAALAMLPALGRDGDGPLGWRSSFTQGVRITPNPLVSMQADLRQPFPAPAFLVTSTAASYWRLTSLSYFDGSTWEGSGHYVDASGRLPGASARKGTAVVTETFQIQDLGSPWLPVAFQPERVVGPSGVSWDPSSGSLLTSAGTADGESYTVTATEDLAALSPAALDRAPPLDAGDLSGLAQYLQLPPGLPANIPALARRLVAAGATEYQKALLLEDFFHAAPFTYTLSPPSGTSSSALENFLFQTHAGFCQQFAAAYAVLAREVGVPARLAVGFTTGAQVGPSTWQVDADDAHAWPEVWFPGLGWVPFEPTPYFSIPHATQYTGPTALPPGQGGLSATSAPGTGGAKPAGPLSPALPKKGGGPAKNPPSSGAWAAVRGAGAVVLAMALVWAASLGPRQAWARRTRRARLAGALAAEAPGRGWSDEETAWAVEILTVWDQLVALLSSRGLGPVASETPQEWAARAGPGLAEGGRDNEAAQGAFASLQLLAATATSAAYGRGRPGNRPAGPPRPEPVALKAAAAYVAGAVGRLGPWYRRPVPKGPLGRLLNRNFGGSRT